MRSEQLKDLINDLSELNNHYAHFLFISQQFVEDYKVKIDGHSTDQRQELLTTDVFTNNQFASQFNVRLDKLEAESKVTKQFILRSLFLLSFFQFEVYLKDVYYFVKSFEPTLPELKPRRSALAQINEYLKPTQSRFLTTEDMNTLEYLKLRRNALVHRDKSRIAQGELKDFIKANGKALNRYWKNQPSELRSLDFTIKDGRLAAFADDEVIDTLKLIRWLSRSIDTFMMNTIGEQRLQLWLLDKFRDSYTNTQNAKPEKMARTFKRFAITTLGIQYTGKQVREILGV